MFLYIKDEHLFLTTLKEFFPFFSLPFVHNRDVCFCLYCNISVYLLTLRFRFIELHFCFLQWIISVKTNPIYTIKYMAVFFLFFF